MDPGLQVSEYTYISLVVGGSSPGPPNQRDLSPAIPQSRCQVRDQVPWTRQLSTGRTGPLPICLGEHRAKALWSALAPGPQVPGA